MVDTDNAKSKREFKKLSKCMGDKLDKEKGRFVIKRAFSLQFFYLFNSVVEALKNSKRPTSNATIQLTWFDNER